MKKIKRILIVLMMSIILLPHQNVQALTSNVSITGNKNLAPGEKGSYTITFSSSDTAYFSYKITGSNINLEGSLSNDVFGDGEQKSASVKITASGGAEGTSGIINVSFTTASTLDGKEISKNGSLTIPFVKPTSSENNTGNTTPPATKPDQKPKPDLPQIDNTEGDKALDNASSEEKLKQEAERKELELEALKRMPLISGVEVVSLSEKYSGKVLETIEPTDNVFDYIYTLPKRIDQFSLKVNAPEDVILTYDETYKFGAEEIEKTIVVKAARGEIDQSFNILVKRTVLEPVEKIVFNNPYILYDDERLDAFIEIIGAEKIDGTHYKFDNLLFQLLVDNDNKAKWLLLNEDLSEQSFGIIYLNDEGDILFILENEDLENKTLYREKYSNKELVLDEPIPLIDPSLSFETSYKGITFEDGAIVYAMNSKGIKGNYFISDDNSFTFAAVAFDQVNMTYKYVAWGSSIVLISLLGALILTKLLNRNKSI